MFHIIFMSGLVKNTLKRLFLKDPSTKTNVIVKIRAVSDKEFLGRLQRGMPLEHISCDEYVAPPDGCFYFNDSVPLSAKKKSLKREADKKEDLKSKKEEKKEDSERSEADKFMDDFYKKKPGESTETGCYRTDTHESLLKEAVEDAKTIRATSLINAKIALNDAFDEHKLDKFHYEQSINKIDKAIEKACDKEYGKKFKMGDKDKCNIDDALRKRRVKVYDK